MIIVKQPEFENDDYLIRIKLNEIPDPKTVFDRLKRVDSVLAEYYSTKRQAFSLQNTNPDIFSKFVDDKPSLRSLDQLKKLDATIYTVACEKENNLKYPVIISNIKKHLYEKPSTRRCMLRFVNGFDKYFISENLHPVDVTCLSLIHYLTTGPKLVFRASDVKNELLVDILTICEFFINPIYSSNFKDSIMSIYCSTAQGVSSWNNFVELLQYSCNIDKGEKS